MTKAVPTYWDYLNLDELLSLQGGLEGDESELMSDELHFILVHQTLELWMKLMLSELRLARDHLASESVPEEQIPHVTHHMGRLIEIFRLSVQQFDVVETLTARDFLDFRDKLFPASGFQSFQMREIEILLGLGEEQRAKLGNISTMDYLKSLASRSKGGSNAWSRIEKASQEVTLRSALHQWLYRTPIHGSCPTSPNDKQVVDGFLSDYFKAWDGRALELSEKMIATKAAPEEGVRERYRQSKDFVSQFLEAADVPEQDRDFIRRVRAAIVFVESYRELPLLAWPRLLLDKVVELEQRLLLFRQRHARMVERLIGRRMGTGGSSGVDYLDQTSHARIFTNLWAVRTVLLCKDALPPLKNSEIYDFVR